jgi:hypothetical protein
MPLLAKALLAKRDRLRAAARELGAQDFAARFPGQSGYLRDCEGYRLYHQRDSLMKSLMDRVRRDAARLRG